MARRPSRHSASKTAISTSIRCQGRPEPRPSSEQRVLPLRILGSAAGVSFTSMTITRPAPPSSVSDGRRRVAAAALLPTLRPTSLASSARGVSRTGAVLGVNHSTLQKVASRNKRRKAPSLCFAATRGLPSRTSHHMAVTSFAPNWFNNTFNISKEDINMHPVYGEVPLDAMSVQDQNPGSGFLPSLVGLASISDHASKQLKATDFPPQGLQAMFGPRKCHSKWSLVDPWEKQKIGPAISVDAKSVFMQPFHFQFQERIPPLRETLHFKPFKPFEYKPLEISASESVASVDRQMIHGALPTTHSALLPSDHKQHAIHQCGVFGPRSNTEEFGHFSRLLHSPERLPFGHAKNPSLMPTNASEQLCRKQIEQCATLCKPPMSSHVLTPNLISRPTMESFDITNRAKLPVPPSLVEFSRATKGSARSQELSTCQATILVPNSSECQSTRPGEINISSSLHQETRYVKRDLANIVNVGPKPTDSSPVAPVLQLRSSEASAARESLLQLCESSSRLRSFSLSRPLQLMQVLPKPLAFHFKTLTSEHYRDYDRAATLSLKSGDQENNVAILAPITTASTDANKKELERPCENSYAASPKKRECSAVGPTNLRFQENESFVSYKASRISQAFTSSKSYAYQVRTSEGGLDVLTDFLIPARKPPKHTSKKQ